MWWDWGCGGDEDDDDDNDEDDDATIAAADYIHYSRKALWRNSIHDNEAITTTTITITTTITTTIDISVLKGGFCL